MLKNLRVRTKLAAVLAVPLVALVVLAALGVLDRRDTADEAKTAKQLTELAAARLDLVHQLQLDRLWISTSGPAAAGARTQLAGATTTFDAARATFADRAAAVHDVTPALGSSLDEATAALETLGKARTDATQGTALTAAITSYGTALDALARVGTEAARATPGRSAATLATLVDITALKADVARLASSATVAVGSGASGAALDPLRQVQVLVDERERAFLAAADDETAARYRTLTNAPAVDRAVAATKALLSTGADRAVPTDVPGWLDANAARLTALREVEAQVANRVGTEAAAAEADATDEARNFALAAAAAVLVSLLLASLVARSIARPLSRLTQRATTLAEVQLPALVDQLRNPGEGSAAPALAEIEISSEDEIGQLARSINSIQGVTARVAEEQATLLRKGIGDIFVSLARRNQTLLDRQIEFIDHLESGEEDPDQLENLFRLDHLATRMRRNAESLLVLAGAEPPRRRGRPVDMADVVRVAVGEVEHYARVQLVDLDEATVLGGVAVDVAHLLAELMENATQFSPPETPVEVTGRRGPEGGYVLTVADRGIGMQPEQLDEANATIAAPPSMGLTVVRSLGFTVVGRLAQRHGLRVQLVASPAGGTTAAVTLPAGLLDPAPVAPPAVPAVPAAAPVRDTVDLALFDVPARIEAPVDLAPLLDAPSAPAPPTAAPAPPPPAAPAPAPATDPGRPDPAVPGFTFEPVAAFAPVAEPLAPVAPPAPLTPPAPPAPPAPPVVITPPAPPLPPPLPEVALPPLPTRAPVTPPGRLAPSAVVPPVAPVAPAAAPASAPADPLEGLARRVPRREPVAPARVDAAPARASGRSPDEVRQMLSRYRSGLRRGRDGEAGDETHETTS